MSKAASKQSATQIIKNMQRLPQGAAAWLAGTSPRALRDRLDCPRNSDDSYDARAVAEWSAGRQNRGELTDAEVERLFVLADLLQEEAYVLSGAIVRTIRDLQTKFGDVAYATFGAVLLERWSLVVDQWPEDWKPSTAESVAQEDREELARRRAARLDAHARSELRYAVVCEKCLKVRNGRKWIDCDPPAGCVVANDMCPECAT